MYEFKPGEYKTRDGRRAVVLSDMYPVSSDPATFTLIGVVESLEVPGAWSIRTWTRRGEYSPRSESPSDLMPPEEKRWMNVYPDRGSLTNENKQRALDGKCTDALGTIELTFSAGKLVEVKIV